MHVSKIIINRGITKENPIEKKWERLEYTIEMVLREGENPELAKEHASTMIEAWFNSNPKQANPENKAKKICKFEGCSKEIDARYSFCYPHFQKIRRK